MCGISGLAGTDDILQATDIVRRMTGALQHRGPDGEGIEALPGAVLGHRRLSIFDLSDAGRQPMLSAGRTAGIVYNGAIYNFRGLRAELQTAGWEFHSNTDTEVLLNGYLAWGVDDLVRRIRGMFAFAIWDARLRKLFLVRDRLGVKPLVYVLHDGRIAFASTVRALKAGGLAQHIDPQGVAEYLEFGFLTDDRSIYSGIRKAPAATILEWTEGECQSRSYWNPPSAAPSRAISFGEAVGRTEELILEAVRIRLDADVPVGALLSGGVDSSLVCWAIKKLGSNITAFTVSTPGDIADESADARATARLLGIKHEVIEIGAREGLSAGELASAYAEPFACSSALGMLRVSKAVKRHATVLLTGDGGDDVFLGYPEHLHFWRAQQLARTVPPGAASLWRHLRKVLPYRGILRRGRHFLDYVTGGLGEVARAHPGLDVCRRRGLLGDRLQGLRVPQREVPASVASARDLLPEFLVYDRQTRFVGEYLPKVDGGAMRYGIEARSPFVDQELWSHAAALPFSIRLHRGRLKAVLREMARRHLSQAVAGGKKRGFAVPATRWLAGEWRASFEDAFRDSWLEKEGWIRGAAVLRLFAREAARGEVSNQLWCLFVLENWLRHERAQ